MRPSSAMQSHELPLAKAEAPIGSHIQELVLVTQNRFLVLRQSHTRPVLSDVRMPVFGFNHKHFHGGKHMTNIAI